MPNKPPHQCNHYGCKNVTIDRFCAEHNKESKQFYGIDRESAAKRGYGSRWQKASKAYLRQHPICVECGQEADLVDHIKPHKGDMVLFWKIENWQAMCDRCHNIKRQRESS